MKRNGFLFFDDDPGCLTVGASLTLTVVVIVFFIAFCRAPEGAADAFSDRSLGQTVSKQELYNYAAAHGVKVPVEMPVETQPVREIKPSKLAPKQIVDKIEIMVDGCSRFLLVAADDTVLRVNVGQWCNIYIGDWVSSNGWYADGMGSIDRCEVTSRNKKKE